MALVVVALMPASMAEVVVVVVVTELVPAVTGDGQWWPARSSSYWCRLQRDWSGGSGGPLQSSTHLAGENSPADGVVGSERVGVRYRRGESHAAPGLGGASMSRRRRMAG
eukprot:NODE_5468_length_674_cov_5.222400_g5093_i0.p1 GENE.NODE_5468_length_674_cov_5.222400_g5093_i0~~NODE_5468_length_674_cov_5.222400_g5093_i0.p1  ORF type:complete len:110 (+),score=11.46 NODE_5468_length_674_cov_5.222400_g5093_i0:255-584(+)